MKFVDHAFGRFNERQFTPEMAVKLINGKMEKFKIAKNPDLTEDEILEYSGNLADAFREGLEDGSTMVFEAGTPWEETVKAIKERRKRSETRMASFRLPVWIIEGLKRNAAKGDVKYSEYVIETLAKAAI